jgi:serine/threonine protein kinase
MAEVKQPNKTNAAVASLPLVEEYYLDKNRHHRVVCSEVKDEVEEKYIIDTTRPLPAFDNMLAKAYGVTNKFTKENNKYMAFVLDKRYPVRLAEINKLMEEKQDFFCNVIAAQIVPLSLGKGRFFTVVVEMPSGISLAAYIQKNGAISEDAVLKKIMPPICAVISFLERKDISHGKINLNNIFIADDGYITVGECVSELCGNSQPILYEDMHRAAASHAGKGPGVPGVTDYYALGVLVCILVRGKNPVEGKADSDILEAKLIESTYKIVTDGMELSPRMLDFLRGVLNDNTQDAWSSRYVDEWLRGRSFNLLANASHSDAGRSISFIDKKYWKKSSLANAMHSHWDEAKRFIREDVLVRWIERSVGDTDLSEKMEILSNRTGGGEIGSSFDRDDELLAQYIMLLDPYGPIRLRGFSAMVGGVGAILADGYAHNKQQFIESVSNVINYSLISYLDLGIFAEGTAAHESIFLLQRCRDLYRKRAVGFGLERSLYELNPTLSCQSPTVVDYVLVALPDFLKNLNTNEGLVTHGVDRQMSAFLAKKMDLAIGLRVPSLERFPDFAANKNIQALALLSMAQQNSGVGALPGLSQKMVASLKNVVDEYHSKYIRIEIIENLSDVAPKGYLSLILKVIADPNFLVKDRLGFKRAVTKFRSNNTQIISLSNRGAVNNMGYRYGLQLSVLLSFFVTTVVVVILMVKAF